MDKQKTKAIEDYLTALKTSKNETQSKEQFLILLAQLFPGKGKQLQQFAGGAENFVKYEQKPVGAKKSGFIDSFYGNLVIEFEYDLAVTGAHAEDQLREYVAKLWSSEKQKSDFICIASDGSKWVVYTPKLKKAKLTSNVFTDSDIELIRNEPFQVNSQSPEEFYFWLDRVFFRDNSIKPTGKIICAEFGSNSFHFTKATEGLSEIFTRAKGMKEVQVAFNNWKQYLKYTYGNVEASEDLFIAHSYLSAFTKLLMAGVLSARKKSSFGPTQIFEALTGKFFYDLNIRNYVERDFFYWINFDEFSNALNKIWSSTYHLLRAYDFSEIDSDFLKDIYQGLVDPEDRHDLGEYYTPDWLCEKILFEALASRKVEDGIPRIADITCGSGSFLRVTLHAIREKYFKDKKAKNRTQTELVSLLTKNVIGFEIHPLAAFIAKTNYMLALEDLLLDVDEPFNIPIYLCDSLLNSEIDQRKLFEKGHFAVQLANKKFEFPLIPSLTDERFDSVINYIDQITHTYEKNELTDKKIGTLLKKELAKFLVDDGADYDLMLSSLTELTKVLHDKVLSHENTIWSFVLKNNFRPIVFKNLIDIVVGNPPWLSFQYIKSEEYRRELEEIGLRKYKIAPLNGKLRANMELATIFLAHAVDSYLKKDGFLFFVLPRSIFSSDNHSNFREQTYTLDMKIEEIWDLQKVEPLFRVPSCVVVASHKENKITNFFPGRTFVGTLPFQNSNWNIAAKKLTEEKNTLKLLKMNKRTALSVNSKSVNNLDTYYISKFKKGATIFPRNYYFVDTLGKYKHKKIAPIVTSDAIKKNSKKPYKGIILKGSANTEFLFTTLLAENILPFAVIEPPTIHLPVKEVAGEWKYLNSKEMVTSGYSDSGSWFKEVEASYVKLSSNKMSLFERVNYHNGLFVQNPTAKFWVLYCTSGKHLCATVYVNSNRFWAEHKTYWWSPKNKSEAFYLAGVLNSPTLNEIIKPFQSMGLLGERDINKKILDVGIPKFDKINSTMASISELAENLSKKIQRTAPEYVAKGVGKKRSLVRAKYKKEFAEIDKLVMKLFK